MTAGLLAPTPIVMTAGLVPTPIVMTAGLVRPLANVMTAVPLAHTPIVMTAGLVRPLVIAVLLVPTAEMTAVLHAMVVPVHHVVNLMTAVAVLVVPVRRTRDHHVVNTTVRHVIGGAKAVPRSHVHPAMNRARVYSVMMLDPVLTAKALAPVLMATIAHAVVAPLTAIAGNAHPPQKSKSALMPSGLPSPVVGVA